MIKRLMLLMAVAVMIFTGCAPAQATEMPAPAVPAAAEAPRITEETAPTEIPAMTEPPAPVEAAATEAPVEPAAPAATEPAAGNVVIFRIVPGESSVSYEVGETFLDQNRFATAIGVTPQVSGEISLDAANPQSASIGEIVVDISQLTSDSSRRDRALRDRFLQSSMFPNAVFKPTSIDGLPAAYTEGQEIAFKVTGDLTVREATQPVTFDVTARLEGGALIGAATAMIKMSAFGVGPISLAMLRTEDDVKLAFNFVARP